MNGQVKTQTQSECAQSVKVPTGIESEKRCTKCGIIKSLSEFYKLKQAKDGHTLVCKVCRKKQNHQWYEANREIANIIAREWRAKNPEKVRLRLRKWCAVNGEKRREYSKQWYAANKEKAKERVRQWRDANKERIRETKKQWKVKNIEKCRQYNQKRRSTLQGKLNHRMEVAIRQSLNGNKNNRGWESLVGYTVDALKKHIEKQFTEGMTLEKFLSGEIHLDHIIPKSAFNYETPEDIDFKRCWALKNLQPLWAAENLKKHNKLNSHFQPSFAFRGKE